MGSHDILIEAQETIDCVPRQYIWRAFRSKRIPRTYIEVIRNMYHNSASMDSTADGDTILFQIAVGVHQGSALSPFLFNVVLDTVSAHIQDQPPWLMMYTDNIALIEENR